MLVIMIRQQARSCAMTRIVPAHGIGINQLFSYRGCEFATTISYIDALSLIIKFIALKILLEKWRTLSLNCKFKN